MMSLPLLLALACTGNDTDSGVVAAEDCQFVPVENCNETRGCTNAVASLQEVDPASGRDCWTQELQNAVCVPQGTFGECVNVETPASPADDPDTCMLFPNDCAPPGWLPCDSIPEVTCPTCVSDEAPVPRAPDITITGGVGLGRALAPAGDTNDDGYPDLLAGRKRGAVLLFGPFTEGEREVGEDDATWEQEEPDDRAGTALAGLGDLDNDGINDIAIGAPRASQGGMATNLGVVYVLRGPLGPGTFELADAAIRFHGEEAGDEFGSAVAFGRLTDDGPGDLVVAAPYTDTNGSQSGSIYVIDGPIAPGLVTMEEAYTQILGEAELGKPLTVADVNGDNLDDLVFGQEPASATVLYGPLSPGEVNASSGERLTPATYSATRVNSVAVGDLDGDGDVDMAWGASDDQTNGSGAGATWAVADSWGGGSQTVEPTTSVLGRCDEDEVGQTLALGDVTGDGIEDLLVGGAGTASTRFGVALFVGPVTGGELLVSEADHWLGEAPATALALMDLNLDGVQDIVTGNMDSDAISIWFGGAW